MLAERRHHRVHTVPGKQPEEGMQFVGVQVRRLRERGWYLAIGIRRLLELSDELRMVDQTPPSRRASQALPTPVS